MDKIHVDKDVINEAVYGKKWRIKAKKMDGNLPEIKNNNIDGKKGKKNKYEMNSIYLSSDEEGED